MNTKFKNALAVHHDDLCDIRDMKFLRAVSTIPGRDFSIFAFKTNVHELNLRELVFVFFMVKREDKHSHSQRARREGDASERKQEGRKREKRFEEQEEVGEV